MKQYIKNHTKRIAAAGVLLLAVIVALLFAFCRQSGEEPPAPSPPVTECIEPSGSPTPSARPSYPGDIFVSPSSEYILSSGNPDAEPTTYPGAEDLLDGVTPPPFEQQGDIPLPIYQDGSVNMR